MIHLLFDCSVAMNHSSQQVVVFPPFVSMFSPEIHSLSLIYVWALLTLVLFADLRVMLFFTCSANLKSRRIKMALENSRIFPGECGLTLAELEMKSPLFLANANAVALLLLEQVEIKQIKNKFSWHYRKLCKKVQELVFFFTRMAVQIQIIPACR